MEREQELFLEALACAVRGEGLRWEDKETADPLVLFRLAQSQELTPLVVHALWTGGSLTRLPQGEAMQKLAQRLTQRQARRTAEFLLLLEWLGEQGLRPAVLKGIVCRSLYPEPEQRPSVDEDLLIEPEEAGRYHQALLSYGLRLRLPDQDPEHAEEIAYVDPERDLYVELHMSAFPSSSQAYGDCNRLFAGALSRCGEISVYGQKIRTLGPTDHLLFLLCHAYKHFLHSGVGLRQAADIALFARAYAGEIDAERIYAACESVQIQKFCAALFRIGSRRLGIDCVPVPFAEIETDEGPLLEDMLSAGVYGNADTDRARTGNITLNAVSASKQGRAKKGLLQSLFPGKEYLRRHFPYAKEHPVLLPVAWGERIVRYLGDRKTNATRTLQIGRERIELLKLYDIIE